MQDAGTAPGPFPELTEAGLDRDPFVQLARWLADAEQADEPEPTGFCLSTASSQGRPSGRMVLLRGLDPRGLVFFTNYQSRKGEELAENPWASATFWWAGIHRQARVEGRVERVTSDESDLYFAARALTSQASAAVSPQSQVVEDRAALLEAARQLVEEWPDGVPRPAHWGGFRILPDRFEFWQAGEARMHDRFRYTPSSDGWLVERLAP